jgi:hypothetical protein
MLVDNELAMMNAHKNQIGRNQVSMLHNQQINPNLSSAMRSPSPNNLAQHPLRRSDVMFHPMQQQFFMQEQLRIGHSLQQSPVPSNLSQTIDS